MTLAPEIRAQIEQMIARTDSAVSAGKTLDSRVLPMYNGAKAALACTDERWLARAATEDARGVVTLAAYGDLAGNYRLAATVAGAL